MAAAERSALSSQSGIHSCIYERLRRCPLTTAISCSVGHSASFGVHLNSALTAALVRNKQLTNQPYTLVSRVYTLFEWPYTLFNARIHHEGNTRNGSGFILRSAAISAWHNRWYSTFGGQVSDTETSSRKCSTSRQVVLQIAT